MSAPGDFFLILALLALLLGCAGYAAGRLHQRWQTAQDREEAYRDGYENGTRSVFSSAVRMLGPKRSARGAAAVTRPAAVAKPATPSTAASPDATPSPLLAAASSAVTDAPSLPVTDAAPSSLLDAVDPLRTAASGDAAAEPEVLSSLRGPTEPDTGAAEGYGFPAPPPPPSHTVAEAAAVGGVVYRPFPDPRSAGEPDPAVAEQPSFPALPRPRLADRSNLAFGTGRRRAGHRAAEENTKADLPAAAPATGSPAPDVSSGRHTVPDELVRAATYRLPPDRVFRAKVPDAVPLPEEPTTRIPPPRPRPPATED